MIDSEDEEFPPLSAGRLLGPLAGKRLVRMTRLSLWPKEEVGGHCDCDNADAFSLTEGPLVLRFDNCMQIGIGYQPDLNSVVIWNGAGDEKYTDALSSSEESVDYAIEASDESFGRPEIGSVIGSRLVACSAFKPRALNPLEAELPSEVGLCLSFERTRILVLFGLRRKCTDLAVLPIESFPREDLQKLVEFKLF